MKNTISLSSELTIEEKAALLEGVNSWNTNGIPRLSIPGLFLTDGPHGLRKVKEAEGGFAVSDNEHSTAFPTSVTVASSWNPENIFRMGVAIAEECILSGVDILLAPGINIKRSPLCGRNFEYYSEDPYISGVFGSAFVRGVQSMGIGCSLKHFAANSNEDYRFNGNSVIDERAFREIYLRAFEKVVKEAEPWTVMCSYNRINGVYASQNRYLLTEILRNEWGFNGLVMTDWGATCDRVEGIKAGCDLDMPGSVWHNRKAIIDSAGNGALPIEFLDNSVDRVLRLIEKCVAIENAVPGRIKEHAELSCEIAKDSAVLLKNDGILPLSGNENLLVVGEMFEKMRFQGAGSSLINPPEVISPRDAFDKRKIKYNYKKGFRCFYSRRDKRLEIDAIKAAEKADCILFFGGLSDFEESEGFDRPHMKMGANQTELLKALINTGKKIVLVLYTGSPVELPFFDGLSALLNMYLPGMHGGEATAALLFGEISPSGKLAESWPLKVEDTSCFDDYNKSSISNYYESIYVGYRYYDKAGTKLRFPFGYGLSYTSFEYSNMEVDIKDEIVNVRTEIKNIGKAYGSEVVQLYVRNAESPIFKAEKELRAFTKVYLKPEETKSISLSFKLGDLAYWNVAGHEWVVENGSYEIYLAASAEDIRLRKPLQIDGYKFVESPYSASVSELYKAPPVNVTESFSELAGAVTTYDYEGNELTLESSLNDFRKTFMGKILYKSIMNVIRKDYTSALKMADSIDRDTKLKNSHFLVRMMPKNSIRSMCMSSSGKFTYKTASALVEIANGRILKGLKILLRREIVQPLPGSIEED